MKTLLMISFFLACTPLFSQSTAEWIGGTPGAESEWYVPANWSNQRVPDEDTRVIIRGSHSGHEAMPVVWQEVEVLQIDIYNDASLTVMESGSIIINGESFYSEGIAVYGGELENFGTIKMINIDSERANEFSQYCHNNGRVLRIEKEVLVYK